jgi:hypothetical protein
LTAYVGFLFRYCPYPYPYRESGDFAAYLADCIYVACHMAVTHLATRDPRLSHLTTALSTTQYAIKGVVDEIVGYLKCPVERELSPQEFLKEFYLHGKKFLDRDLHSVRDVLRHFGIAAQADA